MGVAQYNGNQDIKATRKYFNGTTVLRKGQILHYDQAASKTDADPKLQLGNVVKVVSASNIKFLAGIVPDTEAGKTGPCWVELLQPHAGDVVDAETDGTTDIAAGDALEPDGTLGALIKGTAAAGDALFIAFEANTTDAAKTVIRVQKV